MMMHHSVTAAKPDGAPNVSTVQNIEKKIFLYGAIFSSPLTAAFHVLLFNISRNKYGVVCAAYSLLMHYESCTSG